MTVSAIAVTEGSGKNIWTDQRTVSAVAREAQVQLIGEPSLATYSALTGAVGVATAGDHLLEIMAGASNYVRVNRVTIQQVTAGTSAHNAINIYRLSSAGTGGSAVTPRPYDTGDAASGATAMGAVPLATVGTETTLLWQFVMPIRAEPTGQDIIAWQANPRGKGWIIPPGTSNGIAIKNATSTATATIIVCVEFTETAWL